MTHSLGTELGGKRERLVASATLLMHQQGVHAPTLAAIAQAAAVPPGNVYYYFRTRDDLVDAVLATRINEIRQLLASLEDLPSPVDRLHALADLWLENKSDIARYGCPIGTLCAELTKCSVPGRSGAELFSMTINWAAEQFRQLGQPEPQALATTMLAIVQGAALIASTLGEPVVLAGEIEHLKSWIDRLARPDGTPKNPHDPHDRSKK